MRSCPCLTIVPQYPKERRNSVTCPANLSISSSQKPPTARPPPVAAQEARLRRRQDVCLRPGAPYAAGAVGVGGNEGSAPLWAHSGWRAWARPGAGSRMLDSRKPRPAPRSLRPLRALFRALRLRSAASRCSESGPSVCVREAATLSTLRRLSSPDSACLAPGPGPVAPQPAPDSQPPSPRPAEPTAAARRARW